MPDEARIIAALAGGSIHAVADVEVRGGRSVHISELGRRFWAACEPGGGETRRITE